MPGTEEEPALGQEGSEVRDSLEDGAVPDAVPAAGNHAPAAVPAGVPRVRRGHGGGAGGTGEKGDQEIGDFCWPEVREAVWAQGTEERLPVPNRPLLWDADNRCLCGGQQPVDGSDQQAPAAHREAGVQEPAPGAAEGRSHVQRTGCTHPGGQEADLGGHEQRRGVPAGVPLLHRGHGRAQQLPACLCLQADGRGLLHPVRVLAGRDLLEKPLAVQLQQDFPAVHPQLAGVPGAADHHALPSFLVDHEQQLTRGSVSRTPSACGRTWSPGHSLLSPLSPPCPSIPSCGQRGLPALGPASVLLLCSCHVNLFLYPAPKPVSEPPGGAVGGVAAWPLGEHCAGAAAQEPSVPLALSSSSWL
ncbi:N-terminal EF-hand calcium-binding protein 3 isoform X1 [Vidua macroura]|uniref:N-terminal EF-hand calcium-binding protein 3 isoform X1 n=1 Tax=Vidua macroura TaxID=187451 RepID=UPI0023A7EE36|nr:N-terminal EF-hand calcium-binding protein 3 isoform X1 [Vidua macroura]